MYEVFLGEVELLLWRQLAIRVQGLADRITMTYQDAFETSSIPRYIVSMGYDHPLASTAASGLDDVAADMRSSLGKIAERIALVYMLEPKVGFIPPEQLTDGSLLRQNALIKALETLPRQRTLTPESFDPFLTAVREHYQPAVIDHAVNALLNIYQYEMLYVEDMLLARTSELFNDLREALPHDALLREKVRQDSPDQERDRVELLETKLAALSTLAGADDR
jgi:hypothetical protein